MAIPTNIKTLLSGSVVEWARIEFKETWDPEASLKTVCAFANETEDILKLNIHVHTSCSVTNNFLRVDDIERIQSH